MSKTTNCYPNIHFTVRKGWINDPNGLVYHDGVWELYFQRNPGCTEWGNMTWGHARSRDLLHWKELPDALFPDETGTMFSGCGIVNTRGDLGLPKDALIFCYTAAGGDNPESAGKPFTIRYAVSKDGGDTLIKLPGTALDTVDRANRDPKIYWSEKFQEYYLVLWIRKNDFGIFTSKDLKHFEHVSTVTLEGGYECPDLAELPVENPGDGPKTKYMFWAADGSYYVGDFNGREFWQTQGRRLAYAGNLPYAAQTYSNAPTGEIISVAWLRTPIICGQYTGAMAIPRKFSLVRMEDGTYRLKQSLPALVKKEIYGGRGVCCGGTEASVAGFPAFAVDFRAKGDFTLAFRNADGAEEASITYHSEKGNFLFTRGDVTRIVSCDMQLLKELGNGEYSLIYDKGFAELSFSGDTGLLIQEFPDLHRTEIASVQLTAEDGALCVTGIQ